jgi:hypothetical protein
MNAITNIFKSKYTQSKEDPSRSQESSKIVKMFDSAHIPAFCAFKKRSYTNNRTVKNFLGAFAGAKSTGASTGLHEVVGHGLLGNKLTSQSTDPRYQVDGWDNFHKMANANSFLGGIQGFFRWLFLGTGAGSTSHSSSDQPNGIGQAMGPAGQDAWISIAGSIPGLAVDTLAVTGGMQLRKRAPMLGNTLVGFGLTDNMLNAAYPISAATMSKNQMKTNAENGHDFANFAIQMSAITGIPAQDIAISTAVFWTGFVPLAAGLSYLHTKSHITDVVPDALALKHWMQNIGNDPKTIEQLRKYYQAYPHKEHLEKVKSEDLPSSPVFLDFVNYLLETIPSKTLDKAKKEILSSWEKNLPKDRLQTALTTASILGLGAAIISKMLSLLALATPSLQTAATALSYVAIPLIGVSVLSSGYQLHKDLRCPNSTVPKTAKMLSVAHLVATLACAILIIAAFFTPGFNLIFFGALVFGCIITIVLNHKRSQIIRKQFTFDQAMSPEVWDVMYPLWEKHQEEKCRMGSILKKWTKCVSEKIDLLAFYKSQSGIVCTLN